MVYRVVLADSASADVSAIYADVGAVAPLRAPQWFEHLIDGLDSLSHFPLRCPLAREAEKAGRQIRCLIFGKGRNIYRILYEVDESVSTVWVLHIRHGARKDMASEEIHSPTTGSIEL